MRLILSHAPNARGKIVPLFLSEFPYLVVPLVLQRIQYSAMIGENLEPEKPLLTKTSLK